MTPAIADAAVSEYLDAVRALLGDLDIEQARAEIWAVIADTLGVDPAPPQG